MSAEAVVTFLVGLAQPFIQEAITRGRWTGRAAHTVTVLFSAALALVAVYVTGGFAGGTIPAFSAIDPSPLLGFLVAKLAPVYALSQIVYGYVGAPTIQQITGTGDGAPAPAPAHP